MKNTEENLSLHKKISQFDWSELFKTKNTPLNEEEYKSIKNLVENTSIDEVNNIVTTPAYMDAKNISEAAEGIEKLVKQIILMVK